MLKGQRILVARSAEQVGHEFCRDVQAFGGEPVGPAVTVGDALDLLNRIALDGAIVDEYLRNGTVAPLVLRLMERSIPVVLLKTSNLAQDLATCHRSVKALWAWTPSFHVIRELEAEIGSPGRSADRRQPDPLATKDLGSSVFRH